MLSPGISGEEESCGGVGENVRVSRTPSQDCGRTGGAKRRLPTGAAAKGIPLNVATPCSYFPRTTPLLVAVIGSFVILTLTRFCLILHQIGGSSASYHDGQEP